MTGSTGRIPADYPVERSADLFLTAPAGQALLAILDASDLSPADLAEPVIAAYLANEAMDLINPWQGERTSAVLERLALDSPDRRPLAEMLAAAPELDGWFAPLDRSRPQLWSSYTDHVKPFGPGLDRARNGPVSSWEGYAHKPSPSVLTSTPFADDHSSLIIVTAIGISDLHVEDNAPIRRRTLTVRSGARIYEITGPQAWAALARAYPYISRKTHRMVNSPDGLDKPLGDEELVPDWQAVARDWDGIHVSLGAMLLSTEVLVEDDAGRSTFWGWEFEGTYWLRWVFEDENLLPDIDPNTMWNAGITARIRWPPTLSDPELARGDGPEAITLRASLARRSTSIPGPERLGPGGFAGWSPRMNQRDQDEL